MSLMRERFTFSCETAWRKSPFSLIEYYTQKFVPSRTCPVPLSLFLSLTHSITMSYLRHVIASSPVLTDRSISLWRRFDWLRKESRFTDDVWRRKRPRALSIRPKIPVWICGNFHGRMVQTFPVWNTTGRTVSFAWNFSMTSRFKSQI